MGCDGITGMKASVRVSVHNNCRRLRCSGYPTVRGNQLLQALLSLGSRLIFASTCVKRAELLKERRVLLLERRDGYRSVQRFRVYDAYDM